ncbi:MAG: cation:proton antiporter, partial [Wenzhouxiangellaceae bacterium]|nr:cation:proton antiporter [Wenzhouxiangellaceae bacterium]
DSREGSLLLDVAELDDLSTIVLMALLVAAVPLMAAGGAAPLDVAGVLLQVLFALALFAALAWAFSMWLEPRLTRFVQSRGIDHGTAVLELGIGFVIAALTELAGLSLAIGAFVAGLAFSRDELVAHERPMIRALHDFVTPFFFIGLGLMLRTDAFLLVAGAAALLFAAAVAGKLVGVGLPAWRKLGLSAALLLGASMVPRAEIAMVVMQRGAEAGVAQHAVAAMVLVCLGTILLAAWLVPRLLDRSD